MVNTSMKCNQDMLFDYLFIDDLCSIVYRFINCWLRHKRLNITPLQRVYLHEVAETAKNLFGSSCSINFIKTGFNWAYTGDNSALLRAGRVRVYKSEERYVSTQRVSCSICHRGGYESLKVLSSRISINYRIWCNIFCYHCSSPYNSLLTNYNTR